MFTGIVQAISPVISTQEHKGEWKIQVQRPDCFSDLQLGDSVAVNGVCLTIELLTAQRIGFHLSFETLKITSWNKQSLEGQQMNLEPALKVGDFVGGHFVTGHVDGLAEVLNQTKKEESQLLEIRVPVAFQKYVWKKAFISLNGVSLTVNEVKEDRLFLCLVPETLKRTNLKNLKPGEWANFEVDSHARALISHLQNPLNQEVY